MRTLDGAENHNYKRIHLGCLCSCSYLNFYVCVCVCVSIYTCGYARVYAQDHCMYILKFVCMCVWKCLIASLKQSENCIQLIFQEVEKWCQKGKSVFTSRQVSSTWQLYSHYLPVMCRLRATLLSPKAQGSHESDAALLAYLFPIQRPSPTKKTPEGQNRVSYLWMCQHGPSWNPARTLSNEPDNSTGAFSSQEKWYLQKPLAGWNQNLCCSSSNRGGIEALVNRIGIIQPQLEETQPVTSNKRKRISDAG